jgi:hypothetical protein
MGDHSPASRLYECGIPGSEDGFREHEYSFRIPPNVPPFRLAELGKLAVQGGSSGGYAHLFQQFSIARVLAEAFHQWTGFQLGRAGVALL